MFGFAVATTRLGIRTPHRELTRWDQVELQPNGVRNLNRCAEVIGPCFLMGFGLITIKRSNGQRWICLRPTTSMEQQ